MSTVATSYEHVVLDEDRIPVLAGANTKVAELILEVMAHGSSPAELQHQFPHLSLGEIHSALAYYWDHADEIDADIERRHERVAALRREIGPSPLAEKLRRRNSA